MIADEKRERGPYASGIARREAILDATMDLLAELGYHGMSLRDVARRVGISHPGVIYHFPTKEALLMSVIDRHEQQVGFDTASLATMDPIDALDAMLGMMSNLSEVPIIIEMECMLVVEAFSPVHPAHEHFAERHETMEKVLLRAFTLLQEEGKIPESDDPEELAKTMLSMWYGLMTFWLYDRTVDTAEIMANFILVHLTDDFRPEMAEHYRECGWISAAK